MGRPKPLIAALLLSVSTLAAGTADAQNGPALEYLIRGSSEISPLRSVNAETRAASRYAIVIGNSDYSAIPDLPNALADARVMAQFFESQGYEVKHHENITKRGFEGVLRRVLFDVDDDTEVVVFFAGHGFQIGSENYLVPVDANFDTVYDVPFEAVSLGSLVGIIGARARLQIVILDSCRDNPFAGQVALTQIGNELRETRTGFSFQAAPLNSMLVFSTAPGSVAFDGDGDNSPFTGALVQEASSRPNDLVKDVFEGVRRRVYEETQGRQVPWDSSTLIEPASFGIGDMPPKNIAVNGRGGGGTRGLVRIVVPPQSENVSTTEVAATSAATLDADFVPEAEIRFSIRDALDLSPVDQVTITQGPNTGRLVLTDEAGFRRNVAGESIQGADVDKLLLINDSVQIPAVSLVDGNIDDALILSVNGAERNIALHLTPDACDFEAGDHLDPDGMGVTRYANELRPEVALAACEVAVQRDPEVGRFHYQLGRALTALRRYDEAAAAFERARDLNHARAWVALGNAELNKARITGGLSRGQASDEVLQLFARGVAEGDPYAFYALGRQFMRFGANQEIEIEGYDLMMRALEVGHTFAMNELGYFYLNKDAEYYDPERGLRYLRESALRGDIYGYNNMGLVHLRGLGGAKIDHPAAFEMFTKAAEGGQPDAPFNLGVMYRDGFVSSGKDLRKSVDWFTEGLRRGDAYAGAEAANLVSSNSVPGYELFDAAVIGAKAAALRNHRAANRSRDLIAGFSGKTLDGGAQKLILELGGDVTVDGAFGLGSQSAMDEVLSKYNGGSAATDPVERIIQLAALSWKTSPFRVDLY
ncbi:MAG: caspase family protein [Tateyamaria sp.]|uniref:caspase family protein n=1 Tax=Tateyamaria sp. TaxID=1929288 RepID=UPI00329FE21D